MTTEEKLIIEGLRVSVEGREILKGVDLVLEKGQVHALMGPNGSGKSTLAYTLMGHPKYEVIAGQVLWKGENLLELPPDERAKRGVFLAFQYPTAIPGVTVANFLRMAVKAVHGERITPAQFRRLLKEKMALLKMDDSFATRYLNEGFSGGEKKRAEILQMAVLQPEIAILDETDSGLDIDALRIVAQGVNALLGPNLGVLIITHYQRILNYITPDVVHIMVDGRIVRSGGRELAEELEARGYDAIVKEVVGHGG
jgi:Fe-S cluster assembly ATP-binding protein